MNGPRILVLIDYFLPGEKAGGPVRTLAALIHHLGDRAEFLVVTRDRDLGDHAPYPNVQRGTWIRTPSASRRYLRPMQQMPWELARLLRTTPHDVLYINSLFSVPFTLVPLMLRRCRLTPRRRVVLAPRGQLSPGALAIKPRKKRLFLMVARRLAIFRDVIWHATNDEEAVSIQQAFGHHLDLRMAPNLRIGHVSDGPVRSRQVGDALRIVFLSRVSRTKNLAGALEILAGVRATVTFDIFGPREDVAYWHRCQHLIEKLPPNVKAQYHGVLPGAKVHSTLQQYDILFLPTLTENFGHVIPEALAAGCPPLVSDRTPWRGLARRGVGWDLPLDRLDAFRSVIEHCASEPPEESAARAHAAIRWITAIDADQTVVEQNARLFDIPQRTAFARSAEHAWTTRARP